MNKLRLSFPPLFLIMMSLCLYEYVDCWRFALIPFVMPFFLYLFTNMRRVLFYWKSYLGTLVWLHTGKYKLAFYFLSFVLMCVMVIKLDEKESSYYNYFAGEHPTWGSFWESEMQPWGAHFRAGAAAPATIWPQQARRGGGQVFLVPLVISWERFCSSWLSDWLLWLFTSICSYVSFS